MKFDKKYSQCPSVKVNVKNNLISNGPVLYIYISIFELASYICQALTIWIFLNMWVRLLCCETESKIIYNFYDT